MNLSVRNFIMIGIMASIFIIGIKVLVNKVEVLKPLENTVNAI